MKYLLIIIIYFVAMCCLVLFCNCLRKLKFDLKGKELILYQLSFLILFHIGKYKGIYFYQEYIAVYLLLIIAIYFLLKSIKTHQYIDVSTFSIYVIFFILNGLSIKYIPFSEDNFINFSNLFLGFAGGTLLYLLIINIFTFIFLKKEEKKDSELYFILKNKVIVIIALIVGVLSIVYGIVGTRICNNKAYNLGLDALIKKYGNSKYELQHKECSNSLCEFEFWDVKNEELFKVKIDKVYFKEEIENFKCLSKETCNNKASKLATEYLKNKYGITAFILKDTNCYYNSCDYYFDSIFVNQSFFVKVNTKTLEVTNENFLLRYFEKISGTEIKYDFNLSQYLSSELEKILEKEIYDSYEIEVEMSCNIDYSKISSINFKNLPTIEDFKSIASSRITKIKIIKKFNEKDKDEFFKYIINIYENLYKKYMENNYSQNMSFDFSYTNPFYESNNAYKEGGYIKDIGNSYLIYVKPQPYSVEK